MIIEFSNTFDFLQIVFSDSDLLFTNKVGKQYTSAKDK